MKKQQSNLITLCSFNYKYILVYAIQHFHLRELSIGKWVVCVFVLAVTVAVSFCVYWWSRRPWQMCFGKVLQLIPNERRTVLPLQTFLNVFSLPSLFYCYRTPNKK